ncbi:MAG: UvrD-helicase domain-containing protein [Planctomycetaceae bacterium]|nr:UvrD-helicase domain-containing protein [Planctomycetaceae bacterium]
MSARPVPLDQADRDRAVMAARNVAVTAGAGTGKTYLLVEKILHKVRVEKVPVERILALTFTEKAANEMRQRLRRKGPIEGLEKAEIGTIHGFCTHLLRQYPIEAGVDPNFEVDEGTMFRRRFEEAWPRWLDRELGPKARRPRIWQDVLRKAKLKQLRELAEELCSFAIPFERQDGKPLLDRYAKALAAKNPKLAAALEGKAAPPKTVKGDAAVLARDLVRIDEKLIAAAVGLIDDFAREFRADFLRAGYVSFDGLLSLVHDLLENPKFPDVARVQRERFSCILVDEFQDTDPVQGEVIKKLAQDGNGRFVPGKLFLVGDPKQSIYSFRGADIIAYRNLVDEVLAQDGESAILRTNFRSHGKILDFVNDAFGRLIQENGQLQPRYEPIAPSSDAVQKFAGPAIETILIENAKAEESREVEAELVAEWIESHHGEIEYRDVTILLRSLVHVGGYLGALRSRGIPYVVEGEKYYYGTTEILDFVNLLRAIENPHDRISIVGVLRSPYGGATDQEIYENRKTLDYRLPSPWPIFGLLKTWNEEAGRLGVGRLIDRVFEESFALEIAQAGWNGEQATANLLKLRQKASDLEAKGGCTLREFLDVVREAIRELEEEGESPLADETLDAVRVMSIHKAKGLEFPVVVLPDLHRQKQNRSARAARFDWTERVLGVTLGDAMNAGAAALAQRHRERDREEFRRLLYVAVTRAEDRLVLLGSDKAGAETFLELLRPDFDKHTVVRRVPYKRPAFRPAPAAVEKKSLDWQDFVIRWRQREKESAPPPRFTSPSKLEEAEVVDRVLYTTEVPAAPSRASEIGTICHAVLERLDFSEPRVPEGTDPEAAEILRKFFKSAPFRELARAEILARELPFVLPRGEQIVQGVIDVVYRSGGKTYVADYKTDTLLEPEKYGLIREVYSEAVRRVLRVEPRFKLIYLRQGRAVET